MSTMKTPTIQQFKRWALDAEPAAKAVLMARVFAGMERERVDAYVQPIFESYRFELDPRWKDRRIEPIRRAEHDGPIALRDYNGNTVGSVSIRGK